MTLSPNELIFEKKIGIAADCDDHMGYLRMMVEKNN